MAVIQFFTKIGCLTAQKQIALLQEAGHQIVLQDLLAHPWTSEELRSYFGSLSVQEWFNPNATRIKTGELEHLPVVLESSGVTERTQDLRRHVGAEPGMLMRQGYSGKEEQTETILSSVSRTISFVFRTVSTSRPAS